MIHTQNSSKYRLLELFLLFFLIPVVLATPIHKYAKFSLAGIAIIYVAFLLFKMKQWKTLPLDPKVKKKFWQRVPFIAGLILTLGAILVYFIDSQLLFKVVLTKPLLWIIILFVYSFLSVLPQELVYRKFFYTRYKDLFSNEKFFFFINVICFSLCHLFLKNIWVIVITLIGGVLFTYTYEKTKSVKWVSFEHSLYGYLVFTIGLGEMLAFPS